MDDDKNFEILYRGGIPQDDNFSNRIITLSRGITPKRDQTLVNNLSAGFVNVMNHVRGNSAAILLKNPSFAIAAMVLLVLAAGLSIDMGFDYSSAQSQTAAFDITDVIIYDMMML